MVMTDDEEVFGDDSLPSNFIVKGNFVMEQKTDKEARKHGTFP